MNARTAPLRDPASRRGATALAARVALLVCALSASAQTEPSNSKRGRSDSSGDESGRRAFNPQEMQTRMLSGLRDRMGVTNDEEWNVISERLLKVMEARRATGGGGMMGGGPPRGPGGGDGQRGPGGGGGDGQRGPGGGFAGRPMRPGGGSPEAAALQSAVADKLPDAEIKARLNQLRLTRKANEAKLEAAQDELRAVLTVRQEAMAVLFGILN